MHNVVPNWSHKVTLQLMRCLTRCNVRVDTMIAGISVIQSKGKIQIHPR